jgi:putative two-component system hydrogenase maturation factor HypX/HoxX
MRILLLCHAFNSLTQRLFVELNEQQHDVSVEFDINDETSLQAISLFKPELIIAPYLKRAIPETIWKHTTCLIVHPGIVGDRGPSALDWAILYNEPEWGVTVLQANAEMDAGDIWASVTFPMRAATKASLYRNEVTEAAVKAVNIALDKLSNPHFVPLPLSQADARGTWKVLMQQSHRRIHWDQDTSETVLRKIRCADGFPGVRSELFGRDLFLYDAHIEPGMHGKPGTVVARSSAAICIASADTAVWIGHLKDRQSEHPFKLPATQVLEHELQDHDIQVADSNACEPIRYQRIDNAGFLFFNFYNGAMSSSQCLQLLEALIKAKQQPTRILVLMGGEDFWSNGMHLNSIECAPSAADESWNNINAINDLALEIINTDDQIVISALQGNAGAGGVFLARAADEVWARAGIVLNPHYKDMGNLFGSEYWTYQLPRHAGQEQVERITQSRLPMGTKEANSVGLVNFILHAAREHFFSAVQDRCQQYLNSEPGQTSISERLETKKRQRLDDESRKPLQDYRTAELEKMKQNFYGFDPSYHVARYNFVYKIAKSRTPLTIAKHRRTSDILRRVS